MFALWVQVVFLVCALIVFLIETFSGASWRVPRIALGLALLTCAFLVVPIAALANR